MGRNVISQFGVSFGPTNHIHLAFLGLRAKILLKTCRKLEKFEVSKVVETYFL